MTDNGIFEVTERLSFPQSAVPLIKHVNLNVVSGLPAAGPELVWIQSGLRGAASGAGVGGVGGGFV